MQAIDLQFVFKLAKSKLIIVMFNVTVMTLTKIPKTSTQYLANILVNALLSVLTAILIYFISCHTLSPKLAEKSALVYIYSSATSFSSPIYMLLLMLGIYHIQNNDEIVGGILILLISNNLNGSIIWILLAIYNRRHDFVSNSKPKIFTLLLFVSLSLLSFFKSDYNYDIPHYIAPKNVTPFNEMMILIDVAIYVLMIAIGIKSNRSPEHGAFTILSLAHFVMIMVVSITKWDNIALESAVSACPYLYIISSVILGDNSILRDIVFYYNGVMLLYNTTLQAIYI